MHARTLVLLSLAGLVHPTAANAEPVVRTVASPDYSLTARITTNRHTHESNVEIRRADGTVLALASGVSADAQHGWGVIQAAWTRNSRFFVFATGLTGGHQPWASPHWIFDREINRLFGLWTLGVTGVLSKTKFRFEEPDVMTILALACDPSQEIGTRRLRFELSKIVADGGNSVRCRSAGKD